MSILSHLAAIDLAAAVAVNAVIGVSPAFDRGVVFFADAHFLKSVGLVGALWWAWFDGPSDTARARLLAAILGALLATAVCQAIQLGLPERPRPLHAIPDARYAIGLVPDVLRGWTSFPSDHATFFGGIAMAIATASRRLGILAFTWVLGAICLSRVYLGFHYVSDIAAGAALGCGLVALTRRAPLVLLLPVVRTASSRPARFYPWAFALSFQMCVLFNDVRQLGGILRYVAAAG